MRIKVSLNPKRDLELVALRLNPAIDFNGIIKEVLRSYMKNVTYRFEVPKTTNYTIRSFVCYVTLDDNKDSEVIHFHLIFENGLSLTKLNGMNVLESFHGLLFSSFHLWMGQAGSHRLRLYEREDYRGQMGHVGGTLAADLGTGTADATLARDLLFEKALYQAACKAAIKGGREYPPEYLEELVKKLFEIPDITVCPHGRPVAMTLSHANIDRQFRRS